MTRAHTICSDRMLVVDLLGDVFFVPAQFHPLSIGKADELVINWTMENNYWIMKG
jgi:hypothetical protein